MTREQLYDIIRTAPGNLLPDRGTSLSPDYVLTVKSSTTPQKDGVVDKVSYPASFVKDDWRKR